MPSRYGVRMLSTIALAALLVLNVTVESAAVAAGRQAVTVGIHPAAASSRCPPAIEASVRPRAQRHRAPRRFAVASLATLKSAGKLPMLARDQRATFRLRPAGNAVSAAGP